MTKYSNFATNIMLIKSCLFVILYNQAQFFMVIDPNVFEDGFTDRMSELMTHCRNLEPVSL